MLHIVRTNSLFCDKMGAICQKLSQKHACIKKKDVSLHPYRLNNMNTKRTSKAFIVRAAMTLLLLLLTSATAWAATVKVPYFDGNGEHEYETTATIAENAITDLGNGWYVMSGKFTLDNTQEFTQTVNLILADGADVKINGANGITVTSSLTIYGQSKGTGSLTIDTNGNGSTSGDGIYVKNGEITINGGILTITADRYGITTYDNNITINGGIITVTATGENGIDATGNITINGGNVNANGKHYGIAATGTVTLSGGIVTANDTGNSAPQAGISAKGGANTIYLGGAIVIASSYSGTVTVKDGVTYINKDLTNIDVSTIGGITILPTTCFGIASGNDGSEEGKQYTITSPEELQLLACLVNEGNTFSNKYIQLCNDLDMYGIAFRPIGVDSKFCGNFDGGGYIISKLYINIDDTCIGLFGLVDNSDAFVQNTTISNATINGQKYVGGIVGSLDNGSIKNCFVINSTITSTTTASYYCGAIVGDCGNNSILASNFYSDCTIKVSGTSYAINAGCGSSSKTFDVTDNDGAVSATFLTDSEPVPSTLSGKVLFYREFTGGKASTICLPFAYTPKNSDGKFYTFTGITKKGEGSSATYEATMTEVTLTPLSPNKPYLFMPAGSNTLKPVLFHGTAAYDASNLRDTKTPWTFIGTYSRLTYGTDLFSDRVYGFAAKAMGDVIAGDFVRAADGAYIPAMRCYLKYGLSSTRGEIEELPERITVKLVNDPTSIGTLNTQTGEVTFDSWYSLDGRRFNSKPTKKGLYIYKGRKVTIK